MDVSSTRRPWLSAASVVAIALLIRSGVLIAMRDNLRQDPDGYRRLAETLAQTGEYGVRGSGGSVHATAYRPPLYPWIISLVAVKGEVSTWAVGALHVALGVGTVVLVLLLACRWRLPRWGPLAAVLTVCDPILLNQSALIMTETLAAFMSAAVLLCLTRLGEKRTLGSAAVSGLAIGLAGLCRPTFLVLLAAVPVSVSLWGRPWRRLVLGGAVLAAAAAVVPAPWTLRNYRQCGRPIATTTHGGYTLLLGNNAAFYRHLRESPVSGVWDASRLQQELASRFSDHRGGDASSALGREVARDRVAYAMALEGIGAEPGMFAYASLVRVARLWGVLPRQADGRESTTRRLARFLTAVWYVPLFLLAAIGAWMNRRDLRGGPWLWGVLLCLSFTAVHAVYWSNLRMRAPLTPVICLLAAVGASQAERARDGLKRLLSKEL